MPRSTLVSAVAHCLRTAIAIFLALASLPALAARSGGASALLFQRCTEELVLVGESLQRAKIPTVSSTVESR